MADDSSLVTAEQFVTIPAVDFGKLSFVAPHAHAISRGNEFPANLFKLGMDVGSGESVGWECDAALAALIKAVNHVRRV